VHTLGHVLNRPTLVPVPAFALKLAFGEMAEETILASQRTEPRALTQLGYSFIHPELEGALRAAIADGGEGRSG
jgi:NAD dependent epimerase/dehydratase family enzyme